MRMNKGLSLLLVALAVSGVQSALLADSAQERLRKEASKELLDLNDELLKSLKLDPAKLEGRTVFVKAHVKERADGSNEIKVDSLSLVAPSAESVKSSAQDGVILLQGAVKKEPDKSWKLSLEDVLPAGADASSKLKAPNSNAGEKESKK